MTRKNGNGLKPLEHSQKAKRSNFQEWARENLAHESIDLPSGMTVIVRDIDLEDLASVGSLPNTMIAMFPELQGLSNEEAMTRVAERDPDVLRKLLDICAREALVEPRIGEKTDIANNVISLADLRGKDKMAIFQWLSREADQVRPFRKGSDEPADPAPTG